MDRDTHLTDDAARQFSEEQYAADLSPAQPDDASRIDADDDAEDLNSQDGPAHIKHDRPGRMKD
jgi:hypothetical protein